LRSRRLSAIADIYGLPGDGDTLGFSANFRENMMIALRIFLACLLWMSVAHAQTMYVTDDLTITLRTGPSQQNRIIANLDSGESVEVLERDESNGYSRVRVRDSGDEGWVLTRYLESEPSAVDALAAARSELSAARTRIGALEQDLAAANAQLAEAHTQLDDTSANRESIAAELADIREASASVLELRDQNESLRRRNNELTAETESLGESVRQLGSRSQQNWFLIGALVLFAGIIIGLIAPSLRRRRRTDW
jgi:SH3 domain protein